MGNWIKFKGVLYYRGENGQKGPQKLNSMIKILLVRGKFFWSVRGQSTEGCMGEQTLSEFDLTFGDVLLHKLVQAY